MTKHSRSYEGITVLDYFALIAMALVGLGFLWLAVSATFTITAPVATVVAAWSIVGGLSSVVVVSVVMLLIDLSN